MGDETKALKRRFRAAVFTAALLVIGARPAQANPISGLTKIVSGVLQIPVSLLVGTFTGPPVLGTLFGAVNGTLQGIGMIASGAFELALDGAVLAKAAAPYVLPFVF